MDTALPEGGTAPLREFINMRRGIYGDQTGPRTGTWARHIGEARALCAGHRPGHRRRRYHPGCPGHQNDWLLRMAGLLCGHYHGLLYDPAHRVRFLHGPPTGSQANRGRRSTSSARCSSWHCRCPGGAKNKKASGFVPGAFFCCCASEVNPPGRFLSPPAPVRSDPRCGIPAPGPPCRAGRRSGWF